jgi:hypothetical protein
MSRIPLRDIENYDEFEDDEYEEKRRGHRPHTHTKREQEKKKNWDREVIHDPYGEEDRR